MKTGIQIENPVIRELIDTFNELGIPYSVKNNTVYVKAEIDISSIEFNSYFSVRYSTDNGNEILFLFNTFNGSVMLELKSKDGKKKLLHLGNSLYYSLHDDFIILKPNKI
ncbi:MAG: hypothetical protein JHC26_05155 [Thermofilum sp.]|uniref:hypothetical protein n=1 Tax=Thermofilum sp. TaxID=1961369 RepID=UPI0025849884|nr:hypothetical protein [Thermofilum sp.]MCI4408458.1 hypothetical protein [Thermofilum sp.]